MATNYYLTDGNDFERKTLYVPYLDTYIKNAADIAYLDEATMEMGPSIKDKLTECNPGIRLTDNRNYKIVRNPKQAKNLSIYEPILLLKSDLSKNRIKLMSSFRDVTFDRIMSYEKTGKLTSVDQELVNRFMANLLDEIYHLDYDKKRIILGSDSIVGKEVKLNFNTNAYKMKQVLRNYTQLRNMLIMYLSLGYEGRKTPNINSLIELNEHYDIINGLYPETSEDIIIKLKTYRDALNNIKTEKEKEEVNKKINELGQQINLADISSEYSNYINKNKKK